MEARYVELEHPTLWLREGDRFAPYISLYAQSQERHRTTIPLVDSDTWPPKTRHRLRPVPRGARAPGRRHTGPPSSVCCDKRTISSLVAWDGSLRLASVPFVAINAPHAARCVACHGVGSHPAPVALVGECSIPVV